LAAPKAIVLLADVPDPNSSSLKTIRTLIEVELEKQGVFIAREPGLRWVNPSAPEVATYASTHKLDRLYELRLLPMGKKMIVVLAERQPLDNRPTFSASLTAMNIEELDAIIPRLVESVLTRKPLEATQKIQTVTESEARPFRKKAGEFLWGFGIMVGSPLGDSAGSSVGGALRFLYEMPRLRLDLDIGGMGGQHAGGHFDMAIRGHYLFSTSNFSPFIGGGLGLLAIEDDKHRSGVGASLSANLGVELFRLYRVRLIAEGEALFPLFRLEGHIYSISGTEKDSTWNPIAMFKLSLLW